MSRADQWRGVRSRFDGWDDSDRAYDTEYMVEAKAISVQFIRKGVKQAAQQIRIENIDNVPFERFGAGSTALVNGLRVLIIGYKNHPTVTDTDIQFGDRFAHEGQIFEVLSIETGYIDRVIAVAEARNP